MGNYNRIKNEKGGQPKQQPKTNQITMQIQGKAKPSKVKSENGLNK